MGLHGWKKVNGGLYRRLLSSNESFFAAVGAAGHPINREPFTITECIRLSGFTVPQVKKAWIQMRHDDPQMASYINGDHKYYRMADKAELSGWLDETFQVSDNALSAEALFSSLPRVTRATLFVLPQSREIIFRTCHQVDGMGSLMFLNKFLRHVNSPQSNAFFGDEMKRLAPPIEVAADIPVASKAQEEKMRMRLQNWANNLPSITLRSKRTGMMPGTSRRRRIILSKIDTAKIILAAKAQGFTPVHVVHAAMISATREFDRLGSVRPYLSVGCFDLRKQLKNPYNTDKYAYALYMTSSLMKIVNIEFKAIAQELKEHYTDYIANEAMPMVNQFFTEMKTFLTAPPPAAGDGYPSFVSMGRLSDYLDVEYGSFRLEDFWVAVDDLSPGGLVYLWTLDGHIHVEFCYNETFHTEERVSGLLNRMVEILKLMAADNSHEDVKRSFMGHVAVKSKL